jgi:uncharacterized protein with von Willebrand factor type A (vWA) domain
MHNADVIVITDGESSISPELIHRVRATTETEGVSWFCIGVGPDAERGLQSLAPIATTLVRINHTTDADELVAPVINLENNEP